MCNLDVVVRFAERGMVVETWRTWHNKFGGTGTSQTCQGKKEFKVATAGAGVVITWELLKTGLRTIACLETGFVYWYVGMVITFTTLAGGSRSCTDKKTW